MTSKIITCAIPCAPPSRVTGPGLLGLLRPEGARVHGFPSREAAAEHLTQAHHLEAGLSLEEALGALSTSADRQTEPTLWLAFTFEPCGAPRLVRHARHLPELATPQLIEETGGQVERGAALICVRVNWTTPDGSTLRVVSTSEEAQRQFAAETRWGEGGTLLETLEAANDAIEAQGVRWVCAVIGAHGLERAA